MPLGEANESDFLVWKSEQKRLTPKYGILSSLVPLAKHNCVTMEGDDNQLKVTW